MLECETFFGIRFKKIVNEFEEFPFFALILCFDESVCAIHFIFIKSSDSIKLNNTFEKNIRKSLSKLKSFAKNIYDLRTF